MMLLWTVLGLLCLFGVREAAVRRGRGRKPPSNKGGRGRGNSRGRGPETSGAVEGQAGTGEAEWQSLQTASGCYDKTGCSNVLSMSCSADRHIFLLKVLYGDSKCSTNSSCDDCCAPGDSDHFSNFTISQFGLIYNTCWNGSSCKPRVQREQTTWGLSTFAVSHYSCIRDEDITDFHSDATITASAVAIHYSGSDVTSYPIHSDSYRSWDCQVDTVDSVQRQADVILVRETYEDGNDSRSSILGWSGGDFMEYIDEFQYLSFNAETPFSLSVKVGELRFPDGWAVVRTQEGSQLTVTCGNVTSTLSPRHTGSPETSTISNQVFTDGLGRTSPAPAAASVDVGAVVGGVVAVVVLLVAAVLAVFFFKRWKQGSETGQKGPKNWKLSVCAPLTSMTSGRPSMSVDQQAVHGDAHPGVSNPALSTDKADVDGGGDYAVIEEPPQSQVHQAAAPDTPSSPSSPAEDPDYDLLGQQKPQSSSSNPAATYGRLGEVGGRGEDTDYSYDHVTRGRQAAPDVINSDYDTAALHVTSEGDYNVAGIPKKQQVITGSDYEVAQVVTSEGDYNRVDFQGKKQHVITGSDYDTAEIVTSEGDYNRVDFQERKQKVVTGSDYDLAQE